MRKYSSIFLNIFIFLLGLFLLYLAFYKQDMSRIWQEIQKVKFRWVFIILLISLLNHLIRAARWQLLTRPLQFPYAVSSLFWALMFGSLVNLAIPRLGEISRCLILSRDREKKHFPALLGTVVSERILDVFCLFLVILLAFYFQYALLFGFLEEYLLIPLQKIFLQRQALIFGMFFIAVTVATILWLFRGKILKSAWLSTLFQFLTKLKTGIESIAKIPQIAWFLTYTVLIWITYFLMTYLWFFSLPATAHLSPKEGLALLAIGSIARLAPTQGGGLGAYQLLVSQGLLLLGIAEIYGATLAIIIHATQIIFILLLGGFAPLYFLLKRKI